MPFGFNIPSFPDVPFANGVPDVLRDPQNFVGDIVNSAENIVIGAAQDALSGVISNVQNVFGGDISGAFGVLPNALVSDAASVLSIANTRVGQWGIFDKNNNQILSPDSFKSLSYKQGWRIPNYPMEQGAFQSYNKVQTPFDVVVTFTKGGTDVDRENFLTTLATVANSIDLYNVVTPEYVYSNVSIEHFDYQRTATQGARLLTVDISLLEIRVSAPQAFSNTATPSGTDAITGGIVQAQTQISSVTQQVSQVQSLLASVQ